jgi:electron transport complex protein RnfE
MGVGFTMSLILIALIREVFGSGTITLFAIGNFNGVLKIPVLYQWPVRVISLAAGALLLMGYLKAFFQWFSEKKKGVAK